MRIQIVNANIGENVGDKIILTNTVDEIKKINPLVDVYYNEPIWDYKLTVENFWEYVKSAIDKPISWEVSEKVQAIKDSNFVIVVGGGYLCDFAINEFNDMILTKLFEPAIALALGKPVFFCGHTVEIYNWAIEPILCDILKKSRVTVREAYSHTYLANLGINSEITGDMAFLTDLKDIHRQEITKEIGICFRGDKELNKNNWDELFHKIDIDKIEFFSTALAQDKIQYDNIVDYINVAPKVETFKEVCELITKYKYIITNRFHVVIAAMMMNIPFIPMISINWKLDGLVNMSIEYTTEQMIEKTKRNVEILKELMK